MAQPHFWPRSTTNWGETAVELAHVSMLMPLTIARYSRTLLIEAVCVRFSKWMSEIGIRYENREEGEECYWDHQTY